MRWYSFLFGFSVSALLLVACGSFPYKFYVPDLPNYDGTLRGPSEKEDVNFKLCAPTANDKAPCVVMFSAEFEKLKADRDALLEQLKACQGKQ